MSARWRDNSDSPAHDPLFHPDGAKRGQFGYRELLYGKPVF